MEDTREFENNNIDIPPSPPPPPIQNKEDKTYQKSLKNGTLSFIADLLIYAIVPYIAITLIKSNYPDLDPTSLDKMIIWTLILGPIIAILSFFEAYYYPGHKGRLAFGIIGTGAICIWVFQVFGGTTIRSTYGEYDFFVDITRLIWLVIFGISLKSIYRIMEYSVHWKIAKGPDTPNPPPQDPPISHVPPPPTPSQSSPTPLPPPPPPPTSTSSVNDTILGRPNKIPNQ